MTGEATTNEVNLVKHVICEKKFFTTRARFKNVYRWIDIIFCDFAIEHEFHIASAFELHVDRFVCTRVGLNQRSRHDGERSAPASISCCCKKPARNLKRANG